MKDEDKKPLLDVLWKAYQEHYSNVRHHDSQRATITNIILIFVAAVFTFVKDDNAINQDDTALLLLMVFAGVLGVLFTAQHYNKYCKNKARAREIRVAIDSLLPTIDNDEFSELKQRYIELFNEKNKNKLKNTKKSPDIDKDDDNINFPNGILTALKKGGDLSHEKHNLSIIGEIKPINLAMLWVIVNFVISIAGVFLIYRAWFNPWVWK